MNANIKHSLGDQAPLIGDHLPEKQDPLTVSIECPVGAKAHSKRALSPHRQDLMLETRKHSSGDKTPLERASSAEKQGLLSKNVKQHSAGREAQLETAVALLEREGSPLCSQDCSTSDQAMQSSKTVVEGDTETSGLTCEDASPGDSDSSDSDTSEESETVEPFLSSGEIEGSDLVGLIEENSSVTDIESKPNTFSDEDFATWQRIIHLDALRANSEWIVYSPSRA